MNRNNVGKFLISEKAIETSPEEVTEVGTKKQMENLIKSGPIIITAIRRIDTGVLFNIQIGKDIIHEICITKMNELLGWIKEAINLKVPTN